MGHADHEISAAFSRFDRDGNQILDEDEQERMKVELEKKRVCASSSKSLDQLFIKKICVFMLFLFFSQDALSAELNNLGMNYEKELLEKPPATSTDKNHHSGQTWVEREQFLKWDKSFHWTCGMSFKFLWEKNEFHIKTHALKSELPFFSPHDRLARQVVHLESSVADIAAKIELMMEKLGLQEKTKGNETAGKLSVYSNEVSAEICYRYS